MRFQVSLLPHAIAFAVALSRVVDGRLASTAAAPADTSRAVAQLRADADSLRPLTRSRLAREFLAATAVLSARAPRTVWRDSARTRWWNDVEARALPDSTRARLVSRELDESFFWNTRYGSPLSYVRALEIAARHGFEDLRGRRVADFGCGMIGQLQLMASRGAEVIGIDVDAMLRVLYSESRDLGEIRGDDGRRGRTRLAIGRWPAEPAVVTEVGGGFDLFLSKNTLKNGYLHPAEKVDLRMLVDLGVSDSAFVAALARVVKPGGLVVIYNLSPAPAPPDKPYLPWADGRCPFPRERWEASGFEVLTYDEDDGPAARAMGHALGWDRGDGGMKLESDLFAHVSVFRRR
ncbi:MAG: hypothetical protein HOP12_14170 [Candidatus Eisenbacteria bacterium]|uniref:Methyltransferase domain-containing protein n=1 Tax=Eiseniibacteriota bacterium TaxID=2212470 RepID=A0A849SL16_UNCEI|nr:hypothetical protein [Candidatus Eisenbacteria bacterium]